MRAFISLDICTKTQKEIAKVLKQLQKKHWKVKWEQPEKLHLTLVFLGSIDKNQLKIVYQSIKKAVKNKPLFSILYKGLSCFPSYDYPQIIWLGLKGDLTTLAQIQKQTEINLIKNGLKIKPKPFSPHITLGRVKNCRSKERKEMGRQLKKLKILNMQSQDLISKITVYQSQLKPKGSAYDKLKEILINKNNKY